VNSNDAAPQAAEATTGEALAAGSAGAETTAALELADHDRDLVQTEVLQGELLDADSAPESSGASEPGAPLFASPASAAASPTSPPAERPTIRWGALVWALLFGTVASLALWVLVDPARRDAAVWWAIGLQPMMTVLYGLVAIGVVVVLFGMVGLIRRAERKRRLARG